jgi:hypothetical protein
MFETQKKRYTNPKDCTHNLVRRAHLDLFWFSTSARAPVGPTLI